MAHNLSLRAADACGDGDDLRVVASAGDGVRGDERRRGGVDRGHSQYRSAAGDVGVQRAHPLRAHHPQARAHFPLLPARRHELPLRSHAARQGRRESRARR